MLIILISTSYEFKEGERGPFWSSCLFHPVHVSAAIHCQRASWNIFLYWFMLPYRRALCAGRLHSFVWPLTLTKRYTVIVKLCIYWHPIPTLVTNTLVAPRAVSALTRLRNQKTTEIASMLASPTKYCWYVFRGQDLFLPLYNTQVTILRGELRSNSITPTTLINGTHVFST